MLDAIHGSTLRVYLAGGIGLSRCCCHCALGAAVFRPRRVADGSDVRVRYRGLRGRFSPPGPLQHRWYAGRVYGLVSGSLLLFALLYEITALYGQLLHSGTLVGRVRPYPVTQTSAT